MARVVIDINEDTVKYIQGIQDFVCGDSLVNEMFYAIHNGTVLPKGHGDLIDREVAKEEMREAMCGTGYQHIPLSILNSEFLTPTIIEANKENKNERS